MSQVSMQHAACHHTRGTIDPPGVIMTGLTILTEAMSVWQQLLRCYIRLRLAVLHLGGVHSQH